MNDNAWIMELKPGDTVYVSQAFGAAPRKLAVSRLTNTQVICRYGGQAHDYKFRKMDGRSVGTGAWDSNYLVQPSAEVEQRVRVDILKGRARMLRDALGIPQDEKALIEFIAAIEPLVKKDGDA